MRRFNLGKDKNNDGRGMGLVPFKRFDIDTLMEDFFEQPFGFGLFNAFKSPAIDIYEKDGKLMVKADLPGIKKEDIKLHVDRNILTISGETEGEKEVKQEDYYYSERSIGKIQRSIRLPEGVKQEDIKASYKDGVLQIEIPKAKEAEQKGKDIEVE